MNDNPSATPSALQLFEPAAEEVYSIEAVVHLTQTPRHLIGVYCRHGLIAPAAPPESDGWWFDGEAVRELRQLQRLRDELKLELPALCALAELRREVERLKDEVRFLRG